MENISGLVLINKESGMTSQTVVNRVKRLFSAAKAGHTGTLDPMAEGVLPVLLGRAVKASEFLLTSEKHYRAELLLGRQTDTEDITGKTLATSDDIPDEAAVRSVLSRFVGEIMQVPPMYSAIRVGGRRLMEIARAGGEVEREARPITVYSLKAERLSPSVYALDVHCSKGTYIRTLCADIGRALGVGGCMQALTRTEAAGYPLSRTYTLDTLAAMSEEARAAAVIPTAEIFSALPVVTLPDFYARLARNGQPIYLRRIRRHDPLGTRVTFYDRDGFFAVAEVEDTADGPAARPIRQF